MCVFAVGHHGGHRGRFSGREMCSSPVLVSWGGHNKRPQAGGASTADIYCLTLLEPGVNQELKRARDEGVGGAGAI